MKGWLGQLPGMIDGNAVTAGAAGSPPPGNPFGSGEPADRNRKGSIVGEARLWLLRRGTRVLKMARRWGRREMYVSSAFSVGDKKSNREKDTVKSLACLAQVDHDRKLAIYTAARDGKMRNFAYHEEFGECRETFSRLLQDVQRGEIGVVMTPDAACLSIETSPGWMEAFIQVVKRQNVLIGDHGHDLVYDLREEGDEERSQEFARAQGARDCGSRKHDYPGKAFLQGVAKAIRQKHRASSSRDVC
jgi:hypothetical protein